MTTEETLYTSIGHSFPQAQQSQMFGKPCFKVNGKAFISFFQDCLVCKLTAPAHAEALSLDGTHLFDPSGRGRPMKEWVQIPFAYQAQWPAFAAAALHYVEATT
jgi:hypothetical protein